MALLNLVSSFDKAKKLHEVILRKSGYNKVIRPVKNASDHIDVSLGLKLSQLIDVVSSLLFLAHSKNELIQSRGVCRLSACL